MNKRFFGVLIFAFLVAACGGWVTYRQLISHPPAPVAAPTARTVLAEHDLEAGAVLGVKDVNLADWPGPLPLGAASKLEDVLGRGVLQKIYSKEPISESRLAPKGAGGGLATLIPEGMRAFAVRVNEVAGVAGFVTPGMRVDVIINGNAPGEDPAMGTLARILMQNVAVLSAGQDFKQDAEGKPVITQVVNLLVTPEQAERLSLAANETTVQLVLRNPLDRQVAPTPGAAMAGLFRVNGAPLPMQASLLKEPAPAPQTPPQAQRQAPAAREASGAPAIFTMEIITGTQKTEKQFPEKGGR